MPTLQDQAIRMTRTAVETLFRTARHVPDDKRDWIPMGAARPVQSQLAECALTPFFIGAVIDQRSLEGIRDRRDEAMAALDTLEKAEAAAKENYDALYARIERLTDAELDEERFVSLLGRTITVADALFLAHQNVTYHIGQVNYVQMLLGDTEMH